MPAYAVLEKLWMEYAIKPQAQIYLLLCKLGQVKPKQSNQ